MGIESVAGIWDLVRTWPLGQDDRSTVDNHIRNIKGSLLDTFPNISATVTASADEINNIDGLDRNLKEAIDTFSADIAAINDTLDEVSLSLSAINSQLSINSRSISYLNTVANNVQETYHCIIEHSATALFIPGGWLSSRSTSGIYRITHNLGFSADYSSAIYLISARNGWASIVSAGSNSVKISIYDNIGLRYLPYNMEIKVL